MAYTTINARAEEVASKPAYREALKKRRCLIPADAFYEWQRPVNKKSRNTPTPSPLQKKRRTLCALAGPVGALEASTREEPVLETFTILTTDPNELTEPFHNRMPVILEPRD